ncbi:MAG: polysaccharide biosynthesis/export family protein [Bacteroidales bacterium]|nr:polysaccharide biosynthesis/export family protein [Bacteroidales bacterium]
MAAFCCVACMTPKQVLYLQDMTQNSQIELEHKFEARIAPYDDLSILVSCYDEELAKPFNPQSTYGGGYSSGYGSQNTYGYLVDVNGNIQFPVLGEIKAAGLTRLQLQEKITQMLIDGGYIQDPFVKVRFYNFKIFFLGGDGGKVLNVTNERCTFLEALAMAGDLSNFTKRDRIAVMREVNGKMTLRYLDPRSSSVFNDPYFMLQQNDFIITESIRSKYFRDEFTYWASWVAFLGTISSVSAFVLMIVNLARTNK